MNATELINSLPDKRVTRIHSEHSGTLRFEFTQTGLVYAQVCPQPLTKYRKECTLVFDQIGEYPVATYLLATDQRVIVFDTESPDYIAERDGHGWRLKPTGRTAPPLTTEDYNRYISLVENRINELRSHLAEVEDARFEMTAKSPAKR